MSHENLSTSIRQNDIFFCHLPNNKIAFYKVLQIFYSEKQNTWLAQVARISSKNNYSPNENDIKYIVQDFAEVINIIDSIDFNKVIEDEVLLVHEAENDYIGYKF